MIRKFEATFGGIQKERRIVKTEILNKQKEILNLYRNRFTSRSLLKDLKPKLIKGQYR